VFKVTQKSLLISICLRRLLLTLYPPISFLSILSLSVGSKVAQHHCSVILISPFVRNFERKNHQNDLNAVLLFTMQSCKSDFDDKNSVLRRNKWLFLAFLGMNADGFRGKV
jgi:hypothetical protein